MHILKITPGQAACSPDRGEKFAQGGLLLADLSLAVTHEALLDRPGLLLSVSTLGFMPAMFAPNRHDC